jgi:HEAT repeat protein
MLRGMRDTALLIPSFLLVAGVAAGWQTSGGDTGGDGGEGGVGGVPTNPPPPPVYGGPGDTVPPFDLPIPPDRTGPAGGAPESESGRGLPPLPGTAPQVEPSVPRPMASLFGADQTDWSRWWDFNREPYLLLSRGGYRNLPVTGDGSSRRRTGPRAAREARPGEELVRGTIVPTLLQLLESEPSRMEVDAILQALARIGKEPGDHLGESLLMKRISSYLSHSNMGVAENACVALGVLGHPGAVRMLASLVADSEPGRELCGRSEVPSRMRAFATYGLGLTAQRSKNVDVRRYAINQLLPLLTEKQSIQDLRVASLVAIGLAASAGDPSSIDDSLPFQGSAPVLVKALLEFLEDEDNDFLARAHVPTTLARLTDQVSEEARQRIIEVLIHRLGRKARDRNEVRQSCAMALGLIGDADEDRHDRRIRRALIDASGEGDQLARAFSLIALGQIAGRRGSGFGDRVAGTVEIRRFFFSQLSRAKVTTKSWLAISIGVMGNALAAEGRPLSVGDLAAIRLHARAARSPDVITSLFLAGGLCQDPEVVPLILERLSDYSDDVVRSRAALALGLAESREAVEATRVLLEDARNRPYLLHEVSIALGLMGDEQLVPQLIGLLEEAGSLSTRISIAVTLGNVGDTRAVEPLLAMLGAPRATSTQRAWAIHALGRLADKEDMPWTAKISTDINYNASPPSLSNPDRAGIINFN